MNTGFRSCLICLVLYMKPIHIKYNVVPSRSYIVFVLAEAMQCFLHLNVFTFHPNLRHDGDLVLVQFGLLLSLRYMRLTLLLEGLSIAGSYSNVVTMQGHVSLFTRLYE